MDLEDVSGMNLMGAVFILPLALGSGHNLLPQIPPTSLELSVLSLGIINATAYSTFIFLIQKTGPLFASQTGYVVTIGGMLWGMVLFNDNYSLWVWSSLVVLILGVILVSPRKKNSTQR